MIKAADAMQLEARAPTRALLAERIAPQWRQPLLRLALAWAAILALFTADWAAMALLWWDSSTYNHILLVPLILGWLVWQRAPELAQLSPKAWWPGLVMLGGALILWLLGDISGLATASQLGVVVMAQASVLALFGPRVSYALLFPIGYGLFLVPIGDELVPALQMVTASITIWLTEASGIPAVIEGVFIDTPVGLFEVAEACSGVKFLVAMVALGVLVAHLCFRSWTRRIAFMAASIAIPILANGVRAWGTIYIAQSQGIEFAAGFDHIFYGWVFFGLVMALLLGAGWRFFDRGIEEAAIDVAHVQNARWLAPFDRAHGKGWHVVGAIALLAVAIVSWSASARQVEAQLPQTITMPEVAGWTRVPASHAYAWEPRAGGADRKAVATYRDEQGREVDVVLAFYGAQEEGREAGAFGEGAQPADSEWRWLAPVEPIDGAIADKMQALGTHQRIAMTWFRHDDWIGGSRIHLKLLSMRDRLFFRECVTAMLIVSAVDGEGADGRETIARFHASTDPAGEWIDRIAGLD